MASVTLKDIYDVANRLESKFDEITKEQEKRIRALENFQNRLLAVGGVFSAFVSIGASYVWNKLIPK